MVSESDSLDTGSGLSGYQGVRRSILVLEVLLLLVAAFAPEPAVQEGGFGLLLLVFSASIVLAVRRFRPKKSWPFFALLASGVFFASEMYLRAIWSVGLYAHLNFHSVLVNSLAIAGYIVVISAVKEFAAGGTRSNRSANSDMLLDGTMAALMVLAVIWLFVINPAFTGRSIGVLNKVFLALYPMMSLVMIVILVRIVFSEHRLQGQAYWYFLASMVLLFTGDMLTLVVAAYNVPISLPEAFLPYVLTTVLASVGVTHPSMTLLVDSAAEKSRSTYRGSQIALISIALVMPAVLAWGNVGRGFTDHLAWFVIDLSLILVAILRFRRALTYARKTENYLREVANRDELTGLPNRRYLIEVLEQTLRSLKTGEYLLVAFIDIDQFKLVNDSYGHSVGDELLRLLGSRLKINAPAGAQVGRLGGDEFVVIFRPEESLKMVEARARTLQMLLNESVDLGVTQLFVTGSIGLSVVNNESALDPEEILQGADIAMYVAKSRGRNSAVVYQRSMQESVGHRLALKNELRKAISNNELSLVYQPIVSLSRGAVVGAEALMRWNNPTFGEVSPMEFIPLAEETGLIQELGSWAMSMGFKQRALWQSKALFVSDFYVSVNLSALQLIDDSIVEMVRSSLSSHSLKGVGITVEVTESMVMKNFEQGKNTLRKIRDMGVRIAVDDFGTAYSSLSYLRDISLDILKIDKSFIDAIEGHGSKANTSIVAAILAMAQALDMTVIAEGVESKSQLEKLELLGCDLIQGFYFSKPVSPKAFEEVVAPIERQVREFKAEVEAMVRASGTIET